MNAKSGFTCIVTAVPNDACTSAVDYVIHFIIRSPKERLRVWNGSTPCSCFPLFKGKCSCHMQNWVFLCNLGNLLEENIIVFFFGNQNSKWRSFEKSAILTYFSHSLVTGEKLQKFLQHISHSHTYMYFAHPI